MRGGEELERIAVSRKPFRELSCNSNFRTNLVPEDDRKILRKIVCVKLKDDIQSRRNEWSNNGTNGARQAQEKGELEEDSYKILSQFYRERKDLLYHTADGVVACRRKDEEKILHKHNLIILPRLYQTEV